MRVTIKTIAEKCGISPVTVSRVIARSPNVSEKTRQLVMQTMQEMGYWQKNLEDPTKKDVPQIVALMVEDITDKAQYILQAAAEFFLNNGYLAIICEVGPKACRLREYLSTLVDKKYIKGAIVVSSRGSRAELAKIAEDFQDLPIIATHWCSAWSKIDSVILDSYHGTACAVNYLAERGHRHIALLNSPKESSGSYEEREGYLDALRSNGLEVNESFIFSTDLHRSDGVKIIRKIVKTLPEVTAVLTVNLEMAQGVRSELSVLGKRVPDDISIIPLDMVNDSAGNRDFTAVGANFSDAGVAAARMLLERIQEQERGDKRINIVKKVILEPQVFAGGTVRDLRTEEHSGGFNNDDSCGDNTRSIC